MSLGVAPDHEELATTLRDWARSLEGPEAVRAAEDDPDADFGVTWGAVCEMGAATIALPESAGGGGGSWLEQAIALEACAHALVPGPLLGPAVAGRVLALATDLPDDAVKVGSGSVVSLVVDELAWDLPSASHLLVVDAHDARAVLLAPVEAVTPTAAVPLDLSRRWSRVRVDRDAAGVVALPGVDAALLRRTAVTLAAAEAAGVARWCLATATSYAQVREQFGKPIGAFQAVKHLCAEMLETAEAVTAAAWDAACALDALDGSQARAEQWAFAADIAEVTCFDGAVEVAKSCIQVLGGIGFTHEHDAHLYLRRALALRGLLADPEAAAARLMARAVAGTRRRVELDLEGRDEAVRGEVRETVERIAVETDPAARRALLVETGYLTPHWPAPAGLGADPVLQLVIDQELARAGVERPDIVIAGWALPTILEHGTTEQRERFMRPSLLGDLVWCQLFSEPGAGSDLASLRTRAERVEGGWRLTGQKVWTSVADRADWGICLARTDPEAPQHRGISYFLVDMRSPGIEVRPLREITGEALFNEVFLDDVLVPDDCLVAEPGDGWRLARTTLANERVAMATSRLDRSTERAVTLAADGVGPVAEVAVGRSVALSTVCALLGVRTTLRSLAGRGPGAESSVAKLLGVRNRQDGAELVVRLLGPRAVAPAEGDHEAHAAVWEMLNTRCLSIAGGTTQVLRNVAGERILGLPRG